MYSTYNRRQGLVAFRQVSAPLTAERPQVGSLLERLPFQQNAVIGDDRKIH